MSSPSPWNMRKLPAHSRIAVIIPNYYSESILISLKSIICVDIHVDIHIFKIKTFGTNPGRAQRYKAVFFGTNLGQ